MLKVEVQDESGTKIEATETVISFSLEINSYDNRDFVYFRCLEGSTWDEFLSSQFPSSWNVYLPGEYGDYNRWGNFIREGDDFWSADFTTLVVVEDHEDGPGESQTRAMAVTIDNSESSYHVLLTDSIILRTHLLSKGNLDVVIWSNRIS